MRAATAAAACAVLLTLSSCTPDDPPAPGSPPSAAPSAGDSEAISFGVLGDTATLDPYSPRADDLTSALVRPVYPSLYRFLPDGTAEPQLATDIAVTGGRAVVTLAELSWSDGKQITAVDVVASWRRATPRSGFSRIARARATGAREVTFTGDVSDWEAALATNAYVLPKGRPGGPYAGPYVIDRRRPGLSVRYTPNPKWKGAPPRAGRVTVFAVDSTSTMLALLEDGDLDASAFPSTVNLSERLESTGLEHDSSLGWSSIRLEYGSAISADARSSIGAALDRAQLHEGFIRDAGRVTDTLHPEPGTGGADGPFDPLGSGGAASFVLATARGDELLNFLQDALQLQLADAGTEVELIELPPPELSAGSFEGVVLRRAEGAPGHPDPASAYRAAMPLFQVETFLVWNEGLTGLEVNPTVDGPLWNLEMWSLLGS